MLPWLFRPREAIPTVVAHRDQNSQVALVLLHGFSGNTIATWGRLVEFLLAESSIKSWDIYSLGYPSSLRIDVPNVWAADPGVALLARELRTTLSLNRFTRYQRIAVAAHSMGGLVAQRALVDDAQLPHRISHLFLFGTPSGGLPKARFVSMLKRQLRDMVADSAFIKGLRTAWSAAFANAPPFQLMVIAGDRDEFVPSSSSLEPFSDEFRAVIPGNHTEIVKPRDKDHSGVRLVVDALSGGKRTRKVIDGARIAIELHEFTQLNSFLDFPFHPTAVCSVLGQIDDDC
jgi:pimeloyl-ACP methyl ester carboxylesterase